MKVLCNTKQGLIVIPFILQQPVRKHVNWPEESRDVAAEVRSWVVNKGLGETVLHKAARLQYHVSKVLFLKSSVLLFPVFKD